MIGDIFILLAFFLVLTFIHEGIHFVFLKIFRIPCKFELSYLMIPKFDSEIDTDKHGTSQVFLIAFSPLFIFPFLIIYMAYINFGVYLFIVILHSICCGGDFYSFFKYLKVKKEELK